MIAVINTVKYNNSIVDGPGIRTLVFFQGCDIYCNGCQNKSTWDLNQGTKIEVSVLAADIKTKCINKKLTITGGEPLLQKDAVYELICMLDGFDIALYTGHQKSEVPNFIIKKIKYLKTGPYNEKLKTSVKPFVGSSNQLFEKVGK